MLCFLHFIEIFSKENAVILILCRNREADEISNTLKNFENVFNKAYKYPYLFLNDEEFSDEFKKKVKEVISTDAVFGKLETHEWGYPSWIDKEKAAANRKKLEKLGIIYAGSESYRHMCRFFSGFFYRNKYVKKYDYYWRIEPGVKFFCKMNYDPFEFLKKKNLEYGFIINIREFMETIPTLWDATIEFITKHKDMIPNQNVLKEILDNNKNYNGCHFWSNFEIANLNFFRGELYQKYFDFLDKKGGFYYERWGDAPIHSLAASIFLGKRKIHFFEDIGYEHPPFQHCPRNPSRFPDCECNSNSSIDDGPFSCLREFIKEDL